MLTDSLDSRSFTWTAGSRLASVSSTAGSEGYTYNPFGTRAKVGTRTFLRAGAGVTAGVLGDGNAVYTPGVSELRSGTTTYSHRGLKHTAAQTGQSGSVAASREYDDDGSAFRDIDFKPRPGNPRPHMHYWDWSSGKPVRGPARPLLP
jgi:hypothetical protein